MIKEFEIVEELETSTDRELYLIKTRDNKYAILDCILNEAGFVDEELTDTSILFNTREEVLKHYEELKAEE